jgi:hypothetical protein
MRANFKRYVDQITQNVITLLNQFRKFKLGSKFISGQWIKIENSCCVAELASGPLSKDNIFNGWH